VLLDNMSLEDLREAVAMIGGRMIAEASGGVTLESIAAIAETGVDLISVGALTHSAGCWIWAGCGGGELDSDDDLVLIFDVRQHQTGSTLSPSYIRTANTLIVKRSFFWKSNTMKARQIRRIDEP